MQVPQSEGRGPVEGRGESQDPRPRRGSASSFWRVLLETVTQEGDLDSGSESQSRNVAGPT